MLQYYSIIIDRGISAPRHDKEVVDSLNSIYRGNIYQLTYNVQLTGSKTFDSQILMHSCTPKDDVSLAKELQKHLFMEHRKHGVVDEVNIVKDQVE